MIKKAEYFAHENIELWVFVIVAEVMSFAVENYVEFSTC